jgi:hypothetical protein
MLARRQPGKKALSWGRIEEGMDRKEALSCFSAIWVVVSHFLREICISRANGDFSFMLNFFWISFICLIGGITYILTKEVILAYCKFAWRVAKTVVIGSWRSVKDNETYLQTNFVAGGLLSVLFCLSHVFRSFLPNGDGLTGMFIEMVTISGYIVLFLYFSMVCITLCGGFAIARRIFRNTWNELGLNVGFSPQHDEMEAISDRVVQQALNNFFVSIIPAVPVPVEGLNLGKLVVVNSKTAADAKCPVCRESLYGQVCRCKSCKVGHHMDCAKFAGRCAIFACGGRLS